MRVIPESAQQMSGISKRHRVIRREIPDNACGVSGMTFLYLVLECARTGSRGGAEDAGIIEWFRDWLREAE